MSNRKALLLSFVVIGLVLTVGACKKKVEPVATPEPEVMQEPAKAAEPEKVEVKEQFQAQPEEVVEVEDLTAAEVNAKLQTVYFEYDKHDLGADARRVLEANARVLRDNDGFAVVVQGHCDERGTIEYNLALGERRAKAVRDYLTSLGLSSARMRIVSYGEERPHDPGHGESAWAKNRRGEFVVERGN